MLAVERGNPGIVQKILANPEAFKDENCGIDIQDRDGKTALKSAAERYDKSSKGRKRVYNQIIRSLLRAGADPNIADNIGKAPASHKIVGIIAKELGISSQNTATISVESGTSSMPMKPPVPSC